MTTSDYSPVETWWPDISTDNKLRLARMEQDRNFALTKALHAAIDDLNGETYPAVQLGPNVNTLSPDVWAYIREQTGLGPRTD